MRKSKKEAGEALEANKREFSPQNLVGEHARGLLKQLRLEASLSMNKLSERAEIPLWEIKLHENGGRAMRLASQDKCMAVLYPELGNRAIKIIAGYR